MFGKQCLLNTVCFCKGTLYVLHSNAVDQRLCFVQIPNDFQFDPRMFSLEKKFPLSPWKILFELEIGRVHLKKNSRINSAVQIQSSFF